MIDIRKLKQLIQLMKDNDLTELDVRDSEQQVTLKRAGDQPVVAQAPVPAHLPPSAPSPPAEARAAEGEAEGGGADEGLVEINSPIVGTFYAAASPDADPFVGVGSHVDADTVVCIVEAMKVFNEIKAEISGTIEKALISNGQPVEYGQPIFLVRPD